LEITPEVLIADDELEERFIRASGPGGQNVNKVATAVQLRFDPAMSPALSDDVRQRLRSLAGTKMTADGILVIDARRHRTQAQNREDARQRLVLLLQKALDPPKRRRKTRPPRAAAERRIESKRQRAQTKRGRGSVSADE
jgi:ribosome-associated protein